MAKFKMPNMGFQRDILVALQRYKTRQKLNTTESGGFQDTMLVLGNNSNQFRRFFQTKQDGVFREPGFNDYVTKVAKEGADVSISSKYGLKKTIASFENVPNVKGFSCNNGAYVVATDNMGRDMVLRNKKISPTAINALEKVITAYCMQDSANFYSVSLSGLYESYSNVTPNYVIISGPFAKFRANRYNKRAKDGSFALPKSLTKTQINKNNEISNFDATFNPEMYNLTKNNAYGLTISAVSKDRLAYKGSKVGVDLSTGTFTPKLFKASKPEMSTIRTNEQLASNMGLINALVNAPLEIRKLYEDEISITFTEEGLRLVPIGCDKASADILIAKAHGKSPNYVQRLVSEIDELTSSIPLKTVINNKELPKNCAEFLKKYATLPVEFCDKPNITFALSRMDNISRIKNAKSDLAEICINNLVNTKNNDTLQRFKEDAESLMVDKLSKKRKVILDEFKKNNPDATTEQLNAKRAEVTKLLEDEEKVDMEKIKKLKLTSLPQEKVINNEHIDFSSYGMILEKLKALVKAKETNELNKQNTKNSYGGIKDFDDVLDDEDDKEKGKGNSDKKADGAGTEMGG